MQQRNETKAILTIAELAAYTGWSKSYIYKLTASGKLKFSKPLGKTIFFSRAWVDSFLLSAPCTTANEIEAQAATYIITG